MTFLVLAHPTHREVHAFEWTGNPKDKAQQERELLLRALRDKAGAKSRPWTVRR